MWMWRALERIGLTTKQSAATAASRAYEAGYDDAGNDEPKTSTMQHGYGYRRASASSVRDFGGLDYETVLGSAWRIFLMSPMARRYLQIKRDYELGRGVRPQADDASLQKVIDDFWRINRLRGQLKKYAFQLHLLGEQMLPVFVRKADGRVKLGYIDPLEIEKVILHPENALEKWAVVLKPQTMDSAEPWRTPNQAYRVYRIVREDEGAAGANGQRMPPRYEGKRITAEQAILEKWELDMLGAYRLTAYTGSCFYFSRNDMSNQPRGYSDLLQAVDWIDQDETVLFDLADRENIAGYFVGDVTLTGADADKVAERAKQLRANPPKKGSFNVHNDRETWALQSPDLKQSGSVETHREVQTHAWGGLGLPNAWYGHGDETNRATASAQNDPTWRTMETDQDQVRDVCDEMNSFARDQAEIAGAATWEPGAVIRMIMPEMTKRDYTQLSAALTSISTALSIAEDRGWITAAHAIETWAKFMAEIDITIVPEQVAAEVEQKRAQGELDEVDNRQAWLRVNAPADAEPEQSVIPGVV
jgi:hypothetical protein